MWNILGIDSNGKAADALSKELLKKLIELGNTNNGSLVKALVELYKNHAKELSSAFKRIKPDYVLTQLNKANNQAIANLFYQLNIFKQIELLKTQKDEQGQLKKAYNEDQINGFNQLFSEVTKTFTTKKINFDELAFTNLYYRFSGDIDSNKKYEADQLFVGMLNAVSQMENKLLAEQNKIRKLKQEL